MSDLAEIGKWGYLTSMVPAILGMKRLRGALSDKRHAAPADCLAIGTSLHPIDIYSEELQTFFAVAEVILLIHVTATSGTNERTPSFRVIDVDPVTACPTFVHLNIEVTVIDHMPETTFVAYHKVPPFWIFVSIGHIHIIEQDSHYAATFRIHK